MEKDEKEVCVACQGSGKCARCRGKGSVASAAASPISVVSGQVGGTTQASRICSKCMGSGTCQTCHGSGHRP